MSRTWPIPEDSLTGFQIEELDRLNREQHADVQRRDEIDAELQQLAGRMVQRGGAIDHAKRTLVKAAGVPDGIERLQIDTEAMEIRAADGVDPLPSRAQVKKMGRDDLHPLAKRLGVTTTGRVRELRARIAAKLEA